MAAFVFVDDSFSESEIVLSNISDLAQQKGCKLIAKSISKSVSTITKIRVDRHVNVVRSVPLGQKPINLRGDHTFHVRVYGMDRHGNEFVICIEDYDGVKQALKRLAAILKQCKGRLLRIDEADLAAK